jgi:uracil-DNA glycosylase family 4
MTADERQATLQKIAVEISQCTACNLHRGRSQTVPGAGPADAEIMFIGEAPGFYEDKQGIPFVGPSGRYLEDLLKLIGMTRDQVFITNVVRCRPPQNRDPLRPEIDACRHFLDRQIETINPKIICTLGRYSMANYFQDEKISAIHGKPKVEGGRIYYPLFHPAAVLRNPSLMPVMEEDYKRLKQLLAYFDKLVKNEPPPPQKPPPPPQQLSLF